MLIGVAPPSPLALLFVTGVFVCCHGMSEYSQSSYPPSPPLALLSSRPCRLSVSVCLLGSGLPVRPV